MLEVLLWVALWLLLLVLAAVALFVLARSVWRKAALLLKELSRASDQLAQVNEQLQELAERASDPAVFQSPSELRQERFLSRRAAAASGRGRRT